MAMEEGHRNEPPKHPWSVGQFFGEVRKSDRLQESDYDTEASDESEYYINDKDKGDNGEEYSKVKGYFEAERSSPKSSCKPNTSDHFISSRPSNKTLLFCLGRRRLQVIVKLANIHLTPDQPTYDGGSWHVDGQINEHICSTALFYYDTENITESRLGFRTQANGDHLERDSDFEYTREDWRTLSREFAMSYPGGSTTQNVGSVPTKAERALFFPNIYQHRVAPFKLADPSRPGHRKILALFLVDRAILVISTANVPPQQKSWWLEQVDLGRFNLLPELRQMVPDHVDLGINEDEAKELRKELMAERSANEWKTARKMIDICWNFASIE
ncbi:hypothetical protein QQS21_010411 [Conoideocrella luteorostrata]|uniref:DUF4246 domain-containing protein n=1 Tax=Conoideocrella luteorostrata TaxID=1105319 RepID=A0AAJ0CG02_9HYPO|nr:hypothetical protein QQS21_010411 [Conoideocrella luteorostrata]